MFIIIIFYSKCLPLQEHLISLKLTFYSSLWHFSHLWILKSKEQCHYFMTKYDSSLDLFPVPNVFLFSGLPPRSQFTRLMVRDWTRGNTARGRSLRRCDTMPSRRCCSSTASTSLPRITSEIINTLSLESIYHFLVQGSPDQSEWQGDDTPGQPSRY